jgi:PAS domain S-box-containing protein
MGSQAETAQKPHLVRFYDDDRILYEMVGRFIQAGIKGGDAVIVIATPEHHSGFHAALSTAGVDVAAVKKHGQMILLDAEETLGQFMTGGLDHGMPDRAAFGAVIGTLIESAGASGRGVRAYGEMVDVLLQRGNEAATLALEGLWNELLATRPFQLYCAYRFGQFGDSRHIVPFDAVCDLHSHVIPASARGKDLPEDAGRRLATLEQRTRALEAEVAARQECEAALREREQQLTDFFETASEGLHWVGPDGTILWANRAEIEMLGYTTEEVVGRDIRAFHADADVIASILARLSRGERLHNVEARLKAKDGSIRHVLINSSVHEKDGRFVHTRCFTRDITERKQAEDSLRFLAEASAVLAGSLDYEATLTTVAGLAVPGLADWSAVYMMNADGALHRFAATHQDPAKIERAHEMERTHPSGPEDPHGPWRVLRTGTSELLPETEDGLLAPAASSSAHLRMLCELGLRSSLCVPLKTGGRTLGVLSLATSASGRRFGAHERRLAEDLATHAAAAIENARLYSQLRDADRQKDEFLATASHELRSPLNAIVGWTHLLRSGGLDEAGRSRALETISRNAMSQNQLIGDILDVHRLSTGKLRLSLGQVDLTSVVEGAIETVRPAAQAKAITLVDALDAQAGPILGDQERLQQIVWNLLANAVKFTPKGGRIQIGLVAVNSQIEITVEDSGPGIDPAFLPYIFDRFRQGSAARDKRHGGLGLGLAIVRNLVELHGGSVSAGNRSVDPGAVFTVHLPRMSVTPYRAITPVSDRRNPQTDREVWLESAPSLHGIKVLVLEDEPDSREIVVAVLSQCGAEVLAASSSADAIALLTRERPDVLIADIEIPGEDRYAFLQKVRALSEGEGGLTPAAALTALASTEDRMRALRAGFQIHVPKPVRPAELAAVVASLASPVTRRRSGAQDKTA